MYNYPNYSNFQNYNSSFAPQIQQPSNQLNQHNNIIWVCGEAGAKSYLVAPNTTVQLWDSEEQVIYLKSADASGMPTMKVLDYSIRENPNTPSIELAESDFATKKELTDIKHQIDDLRKQIESRKNDEQII